MADKMRPYVVHQGDHLTKIAFKHGFDPDEVWNHEANAGLRALRPLPDQLYPGDVVQIPVGKKTGLPVGAAETNVYRATVPTTKMTLIFEEDGEPLATELCEVSGLPGTTPEKPAEFTTNSFGALELEIPILVRELEVYFPAENALFAIGVGDMDPDSEMGGIAKRLENLGLVVDMDDELGEVDDLPRTTAVHEATALFQHLHDLEPTGTLDDATTTTILDEHKS